MNDVADTTEPDVGDLSSGDEVGTSNEVANSVTDGITDGITDGVIVFVATWAPAAQALRRALDESGTDVTYIDVDDAPVVADRYVVRSLPTTVQLRGGRETARLVGAVKPSTVRSLC